MKKRIFSILVTLMAIASGAQAQTTVVTWNEEQVKSIYVWSDDKHSSNTIGDITVSVSWPGMEIDNGIKNGDMVVDEMGSIYFEHSELPIQKIVITYSGSVSGIEQLYGWGSNKKGVLTFDEDNKTITLTPNPEEETKELSFNLYYNDDYTYANVYGITKIEFTVGSEAPHVHNYSTEWTHDESTHWHACTSTVGTCDAPKADEARHTFNSSSVCMVCRFSSNPPTPPTPSTRYIYEVPDDWKVNGKTPTNGKVSVEKGDPVIVTPANIPAGKKIKSIKAVKKQ